VLRTPGLCCNLLLVSAVCSAWGMLDYLPLLVIGREQMSVLIHLTHLSFFVVLGINLVHQVLIFRS
jgi:hypothetical protein